MRQNEDQQKNAFIIAFYYLLRASEMELKTMYNTAIRTTISYGGSTNANAAIVGGLIGALVGYNHIEKISVKVLTFDCDKEGVMNRAEFANTSKYLVKNIRELIENRAQP